MLHSRFEDAYKGRKFVITIYSDENGFTTDLDIAGLKSHADSDSLWRSRDEAITATKAEAIRRIDSEAS